MDFVFWWFWHFSRKSILCGLSVQNPFAKMIVHWSSCYEVFNPKWQKHRYLPCKLPIFRKTNFSILSRLRHVFLCAACTYFLLFLENWHPWIFGVMRFQHVLKKARSEISRRTHPSIIRDLFSRPVSWRKRFWDFWPHLFPLSLTPHHLPPIPLSRSSS